MNLKKIILGTKNDVRYTKYSIGKKFVAIKVKKKT